MKKILIAVLGLFVLAGCASISPARNVSSAPRVSYTCEQLRNSSIQVMVTVLSPNSFLAQSIGGPSGTYVLKKLQSEYSFTGMSTFRLSAPVAGMPEEAYLNWRAVTSGDRHAIMALSIENGGPFNCLRD